MVIYGDLVKLCKCDEDDLPVELDLLMVYNAKEEDRLSILVRAGRDQSCLKALPDVSIYACVSLHIGV